MLHFSCHFDAFPIDKTHPQSKGKVEEVIGYVKQSFLEGRVYTGIDSLNSAALAWLDREGQRASSYCD